MLAFLCIVALTVSIAIAQKKETTAEIDGWDIIKFGMTKAQVMVLYPNSQWTAKEEDETLIALLKPPLESVRAVACRFSHRNECCGIFVLLETNDLNAVVNRLEKKYERAFYPYQLLRKSYYYNGAPSGTYVVGKPYILISGQLSIRVDYAESWWRDVREKPELYNASETDTTGLERVPGYSAHRPLLSDSPLLMFDALIKVAAQGTALTGKGKFQEYIRIQDDLAYGVGRKARVVIVYFDNARYQAGKQSKTDPRKPPL